MIPSSPMRALLVLALSAGLAVLLSSCGAGEPSEVSQYVTASGGGVVSLGDEVTLTIPSGALTADATVTVTRAQDEGSHVADEAESMQPAGHLYDIDLGGVGLTAPATLEMAFDPELLPSGMSADGVFLTFYSDEEDRWVPVFGAVDSDRHAVTIETDHLSLWSPVTWVIDELAEKIESGVERLLGLAGLPEAQIPDCALPPPDVTVDLNDALPGCIQAGEEGEQSALVKLLNNRYYSVSVAIPASAELARPIDPGSLSDLIGKHLNELGLLGPGDVYVPPTRQAEFTLLLNDPGEYRFEASSSYLMLGIDFVLIWLGALGIGDVGLVLDALDCLIGAVSEEYLNTALDLWDVARECAFTVAELGLGSVFGVLIALLSSAVKTPALADLLLDDFVKDSNGRLAVVYEPPQSLIAYVATDGNVWTVRSDGADRTRLTSDGGNSSPRWSPDGARIAFLHRQEDREVLEIVNADGSGRTRLTGTFPGFPFPDQPAELSSVRWSSDGCTIYLHVAPGPVGMHPIHSEPLCGGQASQSSFAHFFDVRADGTFAISYYAPPGPYQLSIGKLDDANTRILPVDDEGPVSWSPDGIRLALKVGSTIQIMDESGQILSTLSLSGGDASSGLLDESIDWSADGQSLVYEAVSGLAILTISTGETKVVVQGSQPDWSQ